MKKIELLLLIVAFCINTPGIMNAGRTGQTRKEARQACRIAMAQTRRQAGMVARATRVKESHSTVRPKSEDSFSLSTAEVHALFTPPQDQSARSYHVISSISPANRALVLIILMSLITPTAYAADEKSDSVLQQVASVAASASPLFLPGAGAVVGMTRLLSQSAQHITLEGKFEGKLGGLADKTGVLLHNYHEYETKHPVEASLAMSAGMVAAKTVAAGIAGGICTAPTGGEGAIPGALYGLGKGLTDELRGFVVGQAVHAIAGKQIESFVQSAIDKSAIQLMKLDRTLTEQQAIHLSILLAAAALSSAEFTSVINELGHINLGSFKILQSVDVGAAPLEGVVKAMRHDLETGLEGSCEHGLMHTVQEGLLEVGSVTSHTGESKQPGIEITAEKLFSPEAVQQWLDKSAALKMPQFEHFQHAEPIKLDIMGTGQRLLQHEAYERWKAESSDLLKIPKTTPIDLLNQQQHGPYWQYEGAAGNAWYNEQQRRQRMGF